MKVGSLFSGIEGIGLGLEAAGMKLAWTCESDPFCQHVLAKRYPNVPLYPDVRTLPDDIEPVDLISGGFPCQDISRVGRRAGIDGDKSGMWADFYRVICRVRPRYVLVENSTSLAVHGLGRITGDLAEIGYDTEWDCIPAAAVGAPHIRDRFYLLAYPSGGRHGSPDQTVFAGWSSSQLHAGWAREPGLVRVADGSANRVDRLRALGNAVVPAVAEFIGRRIMEAA